ncbi:MAG TPA: hypothetical protein VJT74_02200 [Pyrinomonadaceae bacterium]|nr:hypothetical protein [Pyrinomonadaceae bacterium]
MRQLSSLSLLLLLVVVAQTPVSAQRRAAGKETVLFDVTGYGDKQIILPIVIVRGGRFVAPPAFNMKAARRRFAATYYRPGQKYRLLPSEGEGGTVTVKSLNTCDPTAAYVETEPAGSAEGRTLATNSASFAGRPVKRRELTEAEQAEFMKLVDPPFRKGGYGEPSLTGVSSGAEAADLDGDDKFELIGTLTTGAKSEHTLFIIAEPDASGRFKPGLLLFTPATDENHDNSVRRYLLEAIDLDGDHVAEAVVTVNDYRSRDDWFYVIYKKQGGRWRSVYRGGGFRCPEDRGDD